VEQRQIEVRKAEERLAELNLRVESDVRTTHDQVMEARARARAQRTAVRQAQRGFDIVTQEYLAGTKTRLEVTEAEVSLRESELNYAEAVYDYLVARAQLDYVVGAVPAVEPVVRQMIDDPGEAPPPYRNEASMENGE
jgi:outer membrane protein TolC